jgi:ribose transport system substrate-binding protein
MKRRSSSHRVPAVALALAVAVCVAAASALSAGAASPEKIRIAYFAPLANTYVQGELRGIAGVLKKEKNVELVKFDTGFDATKQFNSVQDAITQKKFDGFIVLPLDSVGLVPVVQQAIKAGIKVVNADTPLGPNQSTTKPQVPGESGAVFDPWTMRGDWAGQLIVKACAGKDPCKVGWVSSVAALPAEKAFQYHANGVIAKHSNIKIVATLDGGAYTAAGGQKVSQDMLTAHKDLDVLLMVGDQPASGAVLSVDAAGLSGKVKIIGGAISDISKPLIKQGKEWGSWAAYPEDEGTNAIEILLQSVRGQLKAPKGVSPALQRIRKGESPLITKANVDEFTPQYAG